MGTDYTLISGSGASLYLDRAKPFIHHGDWPRVIRAAWVLEHLEDGVYGPGWVAAVAGWLHTFGPSVLHDDVSEEGQRALVKLWEHWERGEVERYDLGRVPGAPWGFAAVPPFGDGEKPMAHWFRSACERRPVMGLQVPQGSQGRELVALRLTEDDMTAVRRAWAEKGGGDGND